MYILDSITSYDSPPAAPPSSPSKRSRSCIRSIPSLSCRSSSRSSSSSHLAHQLSLDRRQRPPQRFVRDDANNPPTALPSSPFGRVCVTVSFFLCCFTSFIYINKVYILILDSITSYDNPPAALPSSPSKRSRSCIRSISCCPSSSRSCSSTHLPHQLSPDRCQRPPQWFVRDDANCSSTRLCVWA